jgi:anti-sigma28 factor (negative regulator of flagellin synthesis)
LLQGGGSAGENSMRTRHDLAIRKTLAPGVEAEERQTNLLKHVSTPGSLENHRIAPEERLQVQLALKAMRYSPEVRTERVEAILAQIEAGTYRVDSMALALKLLGISKQGAIDKAPE